MALARPGGEFTHRIRVLEGDPCRIDRIDVLDEPVSRKLDRRCESVRPVDGCQPLNGQGHGELSLPESPHPIRVLPEELPGSPGKLLALCGTVKRRAALLTTGVRI